MRSIGQASDTLPANLLSAERQTRGPVGNMDHRSLEIPGFEKRTVAGSAVPIHNSGDLLAGELEEHMPSRRRSSSTSIVCAVKAILRTCCRVSNVQAEGRWLLPGSGLYACALGRNPHR